MPFVAKRHDSWDEVVARFRACTPPAAATPFQSGSWLPAWYATLGAQDGVTPFPLEIRDADTGVPVLGLPLIRRHDGGFKVIEFADLDVTDYNAPLLGPGAPRDEASVSNLWPVLCAALGDADILRLTKMPATLGDRANPMALLPGYHLSELSANVVKIDGSWEDYRRSRTKKFRKEMERSFRVFLRDGRNARFAQITEPDQVQRLLKRMEKLQQARIQELGRPYLLDQAPYKSFFRELIENGLSDGSVVMTALLSDPDELVAALIGIVDGNNYAMVRLAQAGRGWSHCSPGKLMIEHTMHWLHGRGVRHFDFTTGNYVYKKNFLVERQPLVELVAPLSLRAGVAQRGAALVEDAKNCVRRFPRLYQMLKAARNEDDN